MAAALQMLAPLTPWAAWGDRRSRLRHNHCPLRVAAGIHAQRSGSRQVRSLPLGQASPLGGGLPSDESAGCLRADDPLQRSSDFNDGLRRRCHLGSGQPERPTSTHPQGYDVVSDGLIQAIRDTLAGESLSPRYVLVRLSDGLEASLAMPTTLVASTPATTTTASSPHGGP